MEAVVELADARDMAVVHAMFRREIGHAPSLVRDVEPGDTERAGVLADHLVLVISVLNLHHTGEDKHIWPRLQTRVPEEIVSIVDVMARQHEGIHAGVDTVSEAVEGWRKNASAETRDALADALDELIPLLREHLALEEERVVPLIEAHITKAEYTLLASEGAGVVPPEKLPLVFGMAMYEGAPEVIGAMIAEMPAQAQPVIRELAPKAYAAYAEQIYGTPTPPRGASKAV